MKRILSIAVRIFVVSIFGEKNKPLSEPIVKGKTTYPENQPSLSEWLHSYKVGSALPKKVFVTKEQILEKFCGDTTAQLIIL